MPASTHPRPFTPEERLALRRLYESKPTRRGRIGIALVGFAISWAAVLFAVVVLWLLVALPAKWFFGLAIGWRSPAANWVLGLAVPSISVWSALYNLRWLNQVPDPRAKLAKDLAAGVVLEERHSFTAAKCFQEPEHGGLMYFLQSVDGRTYAVFDYESQDLGVQGADPRSSTFVPRAELTLARAPESRHVLHQTFSGPQLDPGDIREMAIDPSRWPEPDEYSDWEWSDLERRLTGGSKASRRSKSRS